jgi:hypothetical protein
VAAAAAAAAVAGKSGSFADVCVRTLCSLKYAPDASDPKDSWYLLCKGMHMLEKGEFTDMGEPGDPTAAC